MTSMRTLNRRLLRWRRYTRRYAPPFPYGYWRALDAVQDERDRRRHVQCRPCTDPDCWFCQAPLAALRHRDADADSRSLREPQSDRRSGPGFATDLTGWSQLGGSR